MLDQVKKSISELPNITFEEYFQNYVLSLEDSILYSSVLQISRENKTLDDIPYIIEGINSLTKELQNDR